MSTSVAARKEAPYLKRYREFYTAEMSAAWLYRKLAEIAEGSDVETLERLAAAEVLHANHWADLIKRAEMVVPEFTRPPRRERTLAWIAKRFGLESVLPMLVKLEAADAGKYLDVPEAPQEMSEEEVQHGRTLATIGKHAPSRIAAIESRHRVGSGGWLRAATFGVNDGLVSNLSLVMGIAGGTSNSKIVLLAGIAGLLAGAFSMAAGEWVSVRSQTELYEREIEIEREELKLFPEEEMRELELIYKSKGLEPAAAKKLAERIIIRPDVALDTLAREELGLDPNDLGSPWVAGGSSFIAFGFGAFVPVAPFLFGTGNAALVVSAALSGAMLAVVGFSISLYTGKSGLMSATRMLLVGAAAAGITYVVGSAVGANLS
jgi:VIT1/CCC1 family predicted Fe2+/Mn2+ transporter